MTILLFGSEGDPHLDLVQASLRHRGIEPMRIDMCRDIHQIDYQSAANQIVPQLSQGKGSFQAAFWRSPNPSMSPTQSYTISEMAHYQEVWNCFFPIDTVANRRCINPMQTTIQMENKVIQLHMANQIGLTTPDTLISCNAQSIAQFIAKHPDCIVKNLGMGWDENNRPSSTQRIELGQRLPQYTMPKIFQERIPREKELRVYVVGNNLITVEILTAPELNDTPDWKQSVIGYQIGHVSEHTQQRLLAYQHRAKLLYAAYDIMVTPDQKEIFIECNPGGNWSFLPQPIRDDITHLIVEELVHDIPS